MTNSDSKQQSRALGHEQLFPLHFSVNKNVSIVVAYCLSSVSSSTCNALKSAFHVGNRPVRLLPWISVLPFSYYHCDILQPHYVNVTH